MKIGIIGCGDIASHHINGYLAAGASIAALTDLDPEAARKTAQAHPGATVFGDYGSLLRSGRVEAVSICTPPSTHEEIALAALGEGIHVLCEKPLAHTMEAAARIHDAAARTGARSMIAFRHRFLPAIRTLHRLIGEGAIGRLVWFQNTFCGPAFFMEKRWFGRKAIAGGGCLMDTSSHSVDLFRYLVGEIVRQSAVHDRRFAATDVEDSGAMLVQSAGGVIGVLVSSWVAGSGVATIDIMGEKGRLFYDYMQGGHVRLRCGDAPWEEIPVSESFGFEEEIAHFLEAIREGKPASPALTDGLRAMEVIHEVYAS